GARSARGRRPAPSGGHCPHRLCGHLGAHHRRERRSLCEARRRVQRSGGQVEQPVGPPAPAPWLERTGGQVCGHHAWIGAHCPAARTYRLAEDSEPGAGGEL
ncbi:hypothetical protein pipiens_020077, partial [Culex pipiens pipiens]